MIRTFKIKIHLVSLLITISYSLFSQSDSAKKHYERTFVDIQEALELKSSFSFKQICFLVENTYLSNKLDYTKFNDKVKNLTQIASSWIYANPLKDYRFKDSANFQKNYAIYKTLKDTLTLLDENAKKYLLFPYTYDFNDYDGSQDWSSMFVTKLLATHEGNCHSLPYLYKILADELGATCWLSLAPNHIYIKNRCKKIGWYNTELTNGSFPTDALIMASGYMPLQSIQNKLYMDTLSNQQAIVLCVLDLAKGYEHQTKNYYDGFILKCCDLVLQYHPTNPMALLLKAETLKQVYLKEQKDQFPKANTTFYEMQDFYAKLFDLGYREMPEKMYLKWLQKVTKEKEKYDNKQLKATFHGN
jgi:hypothetical protein